MNRDAAVAQIQQGLGWRSDKATQIVAALQFAQTEREKPGMTLPWFLVAEDQSLSVLTGITAVTLPTGFIKERESKQGNLRYRASSTTRTWWLEKMDEQVANRTFFGSWSDQDDEDRSADTALSPGLPRAYVLRKATIKIYPTPDANYTLTWDFYKAADMLALGSTENSWLMYAPWVLIGDAGMKMAADLRDKDALATFQAIVQKAQSTLIADVIEREQAGRSFSMGSRL